MIIKNPFRVKGRDFYLLYIATNNNNKEKT